MILTEHEREFLAAFISEATTDPFQGPATRDLHRRNIYYSDLSHLLSAYYQEGAGEQEGFGGKPSQTPPPSPWRDREAALLRDREVGIALMGGANAQAS